eukprot:m51a1_g12280 hypothetical protein (224) ;mRNA; r:238324-240190
MRVGQAGARGLITTMPGDALRLELLALASGRANVSFPMSLSLATRFAWKLSVVCTVSVLLLDANHSVYVASVGSLDIPIGDSRAAGGRTVRTLARNIAHKTWTALARLWQDLDENNAEIKHQIVLSDAKNAEIKTMDAEVKRQIALSDTRNAKIEKMLLDVEWKKEERRRLKAQKKELQDRAEDAEASTIAAEATVQHEAESAATARAELQTTREKLATVERT